MMDDVIEAGFIDPDNDGIYKSRKIMMVKYQKLHITHLQI